MVLAAELQAMRTPIVSIEKRIIAQHRSDEASKRLGSMPGIGLRSWPFASLSAVQRYVCNWGVRSTGQCNTACSLSAGVWKPKIFRGR